MASARSAFAVIAAVVAVIRMPGQRSLLILLVFALAGAVAAGLPALSSRLHHRRVQAVPCARLPAAGARATLLLRPVRPGATRQRVCQTRPSCHTRRHPFVGKFLAARSLFWRTMRSWSSSRKLGRSLASTYTGPSEIIGSVGWQTFLLLWEIQTKASRRLETAKTVDSGGTDCECN